MCVYVRRILQQEKRNVLLRQLEEATRITTYLHSQLKRYGMHVYGVLLTQHIKSGIKLHFG